MKRFGSALALLDSVDDELRSCVNVAAYEDVFLSGLVCELVGYRIVAVPELYLLVLKELAPLDSLTDSKYLEFFS